MNSGAKQRLIGVDIAQPAQEILIEQKRLDFRFAAAQSAGELLERHFERLWAERRNARRKLGAVLKTPELAAVIIEQDAPAIERQNRVRVLPHRTAQQQPPGHAEVNEQVSAAV